MMQTRKVQPSMPSVLLAKSCETPNAPPGYARLTGHTVAVVQGARRLLALRGVDSLAAARLPIELLPRLERLVLLATLVHDLGKANEHFQEMLRGNRTAQLMRHEAVSAWLCWQQPMRGWIESALADPLDLSLVIAAAAGHHRKFTQKAFNQKDGCGHVVQVFSGHKDIASLLAFGAKELGLETPPTLAHQIFEMPVFSEEAPQKPVFKELDAKVRQRLAQDPGARALLAIAKALVVGSDVAGSAIPNVNVRDDWMCERLSSRSTQQELRRLVSTRLDGRAPRPFQQMVAASCSPITLVEAGCGNGKTVAAYAWFAEQHVGRQLWVTYPTTGTALEGYKGYLLGIADVATDLESSRRDVDLELCQTGEVVEELSEAADETLREAHRVESLRVWNKDVVACTVDTVLGLMQNQRKGVYAWAGLSKSAVVFDEIHAYDDCLFGLLIEFLEHLSGIPALLMTASLPDARRRALQSLCERVHNRPLPIITGDVGLEELERYEFVGDDHIDRVLACLADGGKVLWVSNTVDRCLEVAENPLLRRYGPHIYHSRFRYVDRVQRHKTVVDSFEPKLNSGACLAVTTQVAEMSLDLSADLLVTDLAPVSSLIQRLGRLNRRATPDNRQGVKPAIVLPVTNSLPYDGEELENAKSWLARLSGKKCSQADLARTWENLGGEPRDVACAWLNGGLNTEPRPVRDGSPGITVLLNRDAERVARGQARAVDVAVPMPPPRGNAWLKWPLVAHLPVPPEGAITYDETKGATWAT